MRTTKLSENIVTFLQSNPNANSNEIAEGLACKLSSAKACLWKLHQKGKIVREKKPNTVKKPGALSQYGYKVSE